MVELLKKRVLPLLFLYILWGIVPLYGQLKLENDFGFIACGSGSDYSIEIKQASTGSYSRYRIEWGDGKEQIEPKFTKLQHTYTASGTYTLKFYGQTGDSWGTPVEYVVAAEDKTITITGQGESKGAVCRGKEMILELTGLGANGASTRYIVDYGDGSDLEEYFGKMNTLPLKHTYVKSSCEDGTQGFTVKVSATNGCGVKYEQTFGPYPIAEQVKLTMNIPEKECTGYELDLDAVTKAEPASCAFLLVKKQWTKNGVAVENAWQVFDTAGTYTFVASATMADQDCGNQKVTKVIRIIRRVKAIVEPLEDTICEGGTVALKGSGSEGDEKKYRWTVVDGNAADVSFAPNASSADPVVTFKKHGSYRLKFVVDNGCSTDEAYVDVMVKKDPEVTEFKPLSSLCPGEKLKLNGYVTYNWTWEGNLRQPKWTLEGPVKGDEFLLNSSQSEFPTLEFTNPGKYTLTVELAGVGCGDGTKLKASQEIIIHDPDITGEITYAPALDVCEEADIVFTNDMKGVNLQTTWTVLQNDLIVSADRYTRTETNGGKTQTFRFKNYGDYKIVATLNAECDHTSKEFAVKIRRAPEVYFMEFPTVCPEEPFSPANHINYLPNGNDGQVNFAWEVTGGTQPALLEGADSRTPKITFPTHGDYKIKLTINNPTSCTSPSLVIEKTVSVSNPKMDLDIKPDKTTICVGEQIRFTNNSQIAETPTYYWGVSPEGYQFVAVDGQTQEAPVIKFTKSGIYNVSAVVTGVCRPETLPFTIVVKQDPEVVIDPLVSQCPGEVMLDESVVHYIWNDNWKYGAESTRRVVWRLNQKPNGAQVTPIESLEWNAFYPKLEFKTPGEYVLQVEAKSDAGCGGTKRIATQKIVIFDPQIYKNIVPKVNVDVVKLPGDNQYQVVEGKPLTFDNSSRGEGIRYTWTVEPAEAVTVSDPASPMPSIVFGKYGNYTVKALLEGTCSKDSVLFSVAVKGIPKFDFKELPNRCDNWEELDLRDYLTCDSAGSTNIDCNWEITPAAGFTLTEGTTSDLFYKIKFTRNGKYTLTLKAQAEYGGVQQVSRSVNVLRSVVTAKAELLKTEGCTTDGLQVVALNKSDGDSLIYTWTVTPNEGFTEQKSAEKLTLDMSTPGNYTVLLKAENICTSDEKSYDVRAYARPEVEMLGASDLGRVCEKGYLFAGAEHVGEIKENNDALTYVSWKVTPKGVSWKNGTDSTARRPDMEFRGGKNYVITGRFKNHCKDTVKVNYTLAVDEFVPVELMPDTTVCARTEAFRLRALPHGGEWSCADSEVLQAREGKNYYFNPFRDEFKTYQVTYERGNGECKDLKTMSVNVNQLPVVDAGADRETCLNGEPITLTGILPVEGEWRGTGVEDNVFKQAVSGEGEFRLEFWHTDMTTGCPNLDTILLTVHGVPDASFRTSWQQCRVTDSVYTPVELGKGNTFSWNFGNGDVRETEDAAVVYQYPEVGDYEVILTATSIHNCTVVGTPKDVVVLDLPPDAVFTLADTAGCGPFKAHPEVDPSYFAGDYLNLKYAWDYGNGNTSTELVPTAQVYPATLFDTTYRMVFRVYNVCGERRDTAKVGAWSKAVAHFTVNPDRPEGFCTPAEPFFINGSTGSGNVYTWDFGGLGTSHAVDTSYTFVTEQTTSDFTIKLLAVNRCNEIGSSAERVVKVKPNPIRAGFTMSQKYICAGDTICFVNNSVDRDPAADKMLTFKWEFGDGEIGNVWDTCHRYQQAGAYGVTLSLDNGCARKQFTDSVFVHVLPVLTLAGDEALCEDAELTLTLSTEEALKEVRWDFGDGTTTSGQFKVTHVFQEPGKYEVTVKGFGDQIPSCPGKVVKPIEVWSKPRVTIAPLDTMGCPPMLYSPKVTATSYDYFTWDYGDGTALTSEMEHEYTNDTNFIKSYNIAAYVENNYGCKEEHRGLIRVYNGPKVAWDKEISYGRPEKVRFINLSRDFLEAIWYLPFGDVVHSQEDQTVIFQEEGVYPLSLTVVNQYGCRDSIFQEYRSYEGGLYFPNSFIPHSTNPKVNQFTGIGMGLKEYKLEIFDMYGNKVWETKALEGGVPSEGWDGRNKKGAELPQGIYMWRAEAIFFSEDVWTGDNNRSGKVQSTQGSVLLLRQ